MISVYPAIVVFCPMNKVEQDGDVCLTCQHFAGWNSKTAGGALLSHNIACRFEFATFSCQDGLDRIPSTGRPWGLAEPFSP